MSKDPVCCNTQFTETEVSLNSFVNPWGDITGDPRPQQAVIPVSTTALLLNWPNNLLYVHRKKV